MGLGKIITISENERRRVKLGTVDKTTNKSFYINLCSWVEPSNDENPKKMVRRLRQRIEDGIRNSAMNDYAIVTLDLRESGIKVGKRSFMSCELTFLNNKSKFNSKEMKEGVFKLVDNLDQELSSINDFSFYATKMKR